MSGPVGELKPIFNNVGIEVNEFVDEQSTIWIRQGACLCCNKPIYLKLGSATPLIEDTDLARRKKNHRVCIQCDEKILRGSPWHSLNRNKLLE